MTRMERQGVTVKAGTQSGARPSAEPAVRGQLAGSDAEAGFEVGEGFERFSQKDDVFCRSFWDPVVRTSRSDMFYETYRTPELRWRPVDGFTRRDYALRNASWHVTDLFAEFRDGADRREGFLDPYTVLRDGPGPPDESDEPPEVLAARLAVELKTAARALGADLIGITGNDERWVYTHAYSRETETEKPQELPGELGNVVVIAQAMDRGTGADRAVGLERDGDGRRLQQRHGGAARDRPVHPEHGLRRGSDDERHGPGDSARDQGGGWASTVATAC